MQYTLLLHRGPVVIDGWERDAANDPMFDATQEPNK
jgi:hypothetical protein